MVKIINDQDVDITIQSRNAFGQDGEVTVIEPGDEASINGDHDNQVVLIFAKSESNPIGQNQPPAATLASAEAAAAEAAELKDATDDDIRAAGAGIDAMPDAVNHKTAAGAYRVEALNSALAAKGFNPINADRRNVVWPPAP